MNKKTLFLTITIVLAALMVISSFAISRFVRNQLTDNLITQYSAQEGVAAEQTAETLELEIAQVQAKLNLIAQLPDVAAGSTSTCNAKLQSLVADPQTKVGNLGRVGLDGKFRCSVNAKLIGVKADTLGTYIDDIFNDPQHMPVMSRAIKPPGSPSYVVAIHVPVWDSKGKFAGTIGGAVYLDDLEKQYLQKTPLADGGYTSLYDDDGTILYHYKPELIGLNIASPQFQQYVVGASTPAQAIAGIKNGTSGNRRYSFDGDQKIAAFVPVHVFPGRNWRISVTVPLAAAQNSIVTVGIDRLLTELPIILCILILILFSFFVWAIRREVFRPMEAIDKAKSEFIGIASHELRTPLGIIKWYVEAIKANDYIRKSPEKAMDYLNEVQKSNERLLELVRNLLTVAHIDEGRSKNEPVQTDIAQAIQETVNELQMEADKRGIKINYKSPKKAIPKIDLDTVRFKEVVENLISNAVKYSPDKRKIEVVLKTTKANGGEVNLSVKDRGIGIPADAQDHMFTRFYRADNAVKATIQGNGIGLYVVKSYVQDWGGKIWYESEEDVGTTFFVTFPIEIKSKKQK